MLLGKKNQLAHISVSEWGLSALRVTTELLMSMWWLYRCHLRCRPLQMSLYIYNIFLKDTHPNDSDLSVGWATKRSFEHVVYSTPRNSGSSSRTALNHSTLSTRDWGALRKSCSRCVTASPRSSQPGSSSWKLRKRRRSWNPLSGTMVWVFKIQWIAFF